MPIVVSVLTAVSGRSTPLQSLRLFQGFLLFFSCSSFQFTFPLFSSFDLTNHIICLSLSYHARRRVSRDRFCGSSGPLGRGKSSSRKSMSKDWRFVISTYSATARASSSASFIFLISARRSSSVSFSSLLYQCTSLFFCHRPVGALMLCPR